MSSHAARRLFSTSARRMSRMNEALKQDSKRNPETLILGGVMVAALGGAGYYLGRNPTNSTSETAVHIAKDGMPWESEGAGKYKYYPGNDSRSEPRDAPSALNAVIIPNVTLPKDVHDKFNKYGRD